MLSQRMRGFILGAVAMVIPPALAIPDAPSPQIPEVKELADAAPLFQLQKTDVEAAISHALTERGAGSKIAATITSHGNAPIFSNNKPINVEIRGLRFDALTSRFSANLLAVSGSDVVSAAPISGRFDELSELPVLKRSVRAGEIINAEDIELRDYPAARTRTDTISDIASLVGKSPERNISEGRPIRSHELSEAATIKKNDLVKMQFKRGGMEISTNGQALSDGKKGSVIMVRNLASKKNIQATVVNANTVLVGENYTQTGQLTQGNRHETN